MLYLTIFISKTIPVTFNSVSLFPPPSLVQISKIPPFFSARCLYPPKNCQRCFCREIRGRMVMVLFLLQEAEAEYQRKLKEALERPAIDRVHPMRIMGSALRAKSN